MLIKLEETPTSHSIQKQALILSKIIIAYKIQENLQITRTNERESLIKMLDIRLMYTN